MLKLLAMSQPIIHLSELSKTYKIYEREAGAAAAMRSLFRRKTKEVRAVDGVSFDIAPGEIVGFLGANGAGKTTTLKMLSGLLHPSSGSVRVLGFEPFERRHDYLRQIALVMGQRNQLVWDIPAVDSFELNRVVYKIEQKQFDETLAELTELLDLADMIKKPVRNLSLGERMKVEIAGVLLHRPKILFLDEPTIGLDVTAQRRIREFIGEYNRRHNATVMLTSHYMADVEVLCKRVIVIHKGKLLFDGALADLVERFAAYKTIIIDFASGSVSGLEKYGEVVAQTPAQATLRIHKSEAAKITSKMLAELPVSDLTIQDPPIESVIEDVFASGNDKPAASGETEST